MPCLLLKRNAARRMRGPGSSKKRRGYVSNSYLHLLVGLVQYESHKAQTTCIYKLRYEWDTCLLPKGLFRIVCVCISQVTHIFASRRHPALRSKSNIYCLDSLCSIRRCGNRDTRRRSFGSKSWKENSCWSSGVRRILAIVMVPNRPTRPQYLSLNKSVRSPRCLNHLRPIQEVDRRAEAAEGGEVQVPT